ncbi:MAG: PAS domain S-box protein [Verrucomicrobia bacterium]|nr:PAS domain S-box protein [Verrucomicrobiota bacterium]
MLSLLATAIATDKGEAIILTDLSGHVLFWNEGAELLYGIGSTEMLGKSLTRRVAASSFELPGWAEALASGEYEADVLDQRHDGTPVWTRTRVSLLRDNAGRSVGVRIVARDVSVRLRSEERFRMLAEMLPDIISIFDRHGVIIFNSTAARKIHGYKSEEMQGRSTFEWIHPDDRARVAKAFESVLANPMEEAVVRYRYLNADGSYIWMEAAGRNELANPHIQGIIAVSRDISGQVLTEQLLRDDEQRYRMLFAANPHPMMVFDLETLRFLEINVTALELYGYSHDEFLSLTIRDIRPPEDLPRLDSLIERLNSELVGGKIPGAWRHRLKSGRIIDVEVVANRFEWAGRPACIVLVNDVTEHLKLATKLQQTQKLESLGLLAGGIAHDFNNILTAILGHASLAAFDVPPNSPLGGSIQLIEESAKRAAELCQQMLAYSGRGRISVRSVDLGCFVQDIVKLLRVSIGKNCRLMQNPNPGLPLIEVDTTQLQQVVMNLVINASEAIGAQEGTIRLATGCLHVDRTMLETMYLAQDMAEGEYVELKISDTGCGMSPETIARVFDPFFTTKITGRGLGLAAVLGIVRSHNGAIRVESEPGNGTTFTLLFPVVSGSASTAVAVTPPVKPIPLRPKLRTVLVVDDEESVRLIARSMLMHWGFRVILADDGVEDVDKFRKHQSEIDLVLLDLTMPKLNGYDAFNELRKLSPEVCVLMMSGFDESAETQRLIDHDHAGFIQKPFTAQGLLANISTVLNEEVA